MGSDLYMNPPRRDDIASDLRAEVRRLEVRCTDVVADRDRLAGWLRELGSIYIGAKLGEALARLDGYEEWIAEDERSRNEKRATLAANARAKLTDEELAAVIERGWNFGKGEG